MASERGIRVVLRVRPQNQAEIARDGTCCITFKSTTEVEVKVRCHYVRAM